MLQLILKLIGKIILDSIGWTKKLGGEIQPKLKPIVEMNTTKFEEFKKNLDDLEKDPIQVDLYLKAHGLEQVEGLKEYILNNDIKQDSVNNLIQAQNYQNIANQAHGITGVKKAIDAYNKGIREGTLDTTKFAETISQSNSSLGNYLTELEGAEAGLKGYAGSLIATTAKTFALQAATMALNTAVSFGISFLVSKGIELITTGFDNWINRVEKARERTSELFDEFKQMNDTLADHKKTVAELADRYDELSKGVNLSTNENESLSTEEYEKFLDINEQLAESFPSLTKGIDENGNSILTLGTNGITAKEELEELLKTEEDLNNFRVAQNLGDAFSGVLTYVEDANEASEQLNNTLNKTNEEIGQLQDFVENGINLKKDGYKLFSGETADTAKMDYVYTMQSTAQEFMNGLDDSRRNELLTKGVNESNLFTIETNEMVGTFDFYANLFSLTPEEISNLEALIADNVTTLNGALVDQFSSQKQEATDTINQAQNSWRDFIPNLISGMRSKQTFKDLDSDLQDIAVQIVEGLDYSYADAMNEYNPNDPYAYIRDKFIVPMGNLSDSDKALLKSNYKELFKLDPENLSKDNQDKITSLIDTLAGILEKDPLEIRATLGFDVEDMQDKYNVALAEAKRQLGGYGHDDRGFETNNEVGYKLDSFWNENVKTEEDWVLWEKVTEGITSATEAMEAYTNAKKANSVGENEAPLSFSKAWNKLGKESDEKTAKKSEEAKEKLLELAEAGKLTVEAFEDSSIAENFMKQTGLSAEEATQKINDLIENVKQLDAMRKGITSITSAYDEKKDSKQHIVSSSTLDSMYDTLGIEEWDNANKKVWENYKKCATDGKKSMADTKKAQDELATSYVSSNNFLANLDDTNQEYYRTLLKEMGVTNADAIVTSELAKKKGLAAIETADLTNMTSDEIAKLIEEKGKTDDARNAMKLFALEKVYANGKALDTTEDINQLIRLMDSLGLATEAIQTYRDYLANSNSNAMDAQIGAFLKNNAEKDYNKIIKNLTKEVKVGTGKINTTKGNKTKDSSGNSKKNKSKNSKTEIDWIARLIDRTTTKVDILSAKLQNLFKVKTKNSNLNKQIKETTKLINSYGKAVKKYENKADSVKLSSDLKKLVQNGKIKGSYKDLVKEYGEKTANKIQAYQNWYETCHFA